ncbi:MAG: hypothetical protein J6R92_01230 [Akkermansia sp.]|nr:hypothetical protein [Akkermansia sp.]
MNVFSTCWNSRRHKDGGAMCDEIRELGFEYIEASHGLSLDMLPGIIKAVDSGRIKVAGVHNFCPAPMEVPGDAPDAYTFTSHRPETRARACGRWGSRQVAWPICWRDAARRAACGWAGTT